MTSSRSFVDIPLNPKKKRSESIAKSPPLMISTSPKNELSPIISHKTSDSDDDDIQDSEEDFVVLNTKVVQNHFLNTKLTFFQIEKVIPKFYIPFTQKKEVCKTLVHKWLSEQYFPIYFHFSLISDILCLQTWTKSLKS